MNRPHDSWAEVYDLAYTEEYGAFYERLTTLTIAEIERLIAPCSSIVDFGAGSGRLSIPLARAGHNVTAVEPSGPMLQQLQSAAGGLKIKCIQATMQDFQGAPTFDLAICVFTVVIYLLDHDQLSQAISSAKRCLKRGGKLLLDVPSRAVFQSHRCCTERLNRSVSIRPWEGDVHEYQEEIEVICSSGDRRTFEDRFLIRAWAPKDVLSVAEQSGFALTEDLTERFSGAGSNYYVLTHGSKEG